MPVVGCIPLGSGTEITCHQRPDQGLQQLHWRDLADVHLDCQVSIGVGLVVEIRDG
jgi:hypothetical protein